MASRDRWRRALAAFLCWLPLTAFAAAQERAPSRFEKVLWCSDVADGPRWARAHGYTAVQLGRGGDAAAVRALGLRFYLDQPVGKGLLELRDEQWRPVVQAYERTRDPKVLVRPTCFAEPGRLDRAAAAAAAEARRVGPEGMLFVALADEASSTRHNAPLDTCRCAHCLRAFRRYCERRFAAVDQLNAVLGTHYQRFSDVVPPTTDQVRRRELGEQALPADLRPFSLWLEFVDEQFAAAVATMCERVAAAVPGIPVGLTGLAVPGAFGGHDYARLLPGQTLVEPYDTGGAIELCESLVAPSVHRYATVAPPSRERLRGNVRLADHVRATLCRHASHGVAGVVVWNDATVRGADGAKTPFGEALQAAFRRYGPTFDELAGAIIEPSEVWVVESQPSVRAWWMIDSAQDGLTWIRRLASHEATHSTSQAARKAWIRLLQDLGLQPRFVPAGQLAERILVERPRCVVLPATLSLSDRSAQALDVYVQNGGTLLADHSVGLYDEHLLRRDRGVLDGLFGITERSLRWHDLLVREGRASARVRGLPHAENGLVGAVAVRRGDVATFLERSHGRGRACYLNTAVVGYADWRLDPQQIGRARELRRRVRSVLRRARVLPPCEVFGKGLPTLIERVALRLRDGRRVVAVRVNALERPAILRQLQQRGPIEVELIWPRDLHVRELHGVDHGTAARTKVTLDPFGAVFVEVSG
ncbi:MAG TPA: hypothetical protein ENI87_05585 [bacterium]|nr:hypothetical protein [bacterium]